MSDHEHEEEFELEVQIPVPSGIFSDDYDEEATTCGKWLDNARSEGVLGEEEKASGSGIMSVVRSAIRTGEAETAGYSPDEAYVMFAFITGFQSGRSFQDFYQKSLQSQALIGVLSQIMPDGLLDQLAKNAEEQAEKESDGD